MQRLIDPPSRFSPLSEWTDFLRAMEEGLEANPGDEDYLFHIDMAKTEIAKKQEASAEVAHA